MPFKSAWIKGKEKDLAQYCCPDLPPGWKLFNPAALLGSPAGHRKLAEAIYNELAARQIEYAPELYNWQEKSQLIRTPGEILGPPNQGTCLDLSLLFAGLCLAHQLRPLIIVLDGHAFAAVCLTQTLADKPLFGRAGEAVFRDARGLALPSQRQELQDLLSQDFLPVECTGFAHWGGAPANLPEGPGRNGGLLDFAAAVEVGKKQLLGSRTLMFALDTEWVQRELGVGIAEANESRGPVFKNLFSPLLQRCMIGFGGRTVELAALQSLLDTPSGIPTVVTAPAGFGKTALIANFVSRNANRVVYHFFNGQSNPRFLEERFFLQNIVQQLSSLHGREGDTGGSVDDLAATFFDLIRRPPGTPALIVLDGLDEITSWKVAPYLEPNRPPELGLLASVRLNGQDWRSEYRLREPKLHELRLGGLSKAEVAEVLRAAKSTEAEAIAADDGLLEKLYTVTANSPGGGPAYTSLLAKEIAAGDLTRADLNNLPATFRLYLAWMWEHEEAAAKNVGALEILQLLAAALGPLTREDLEALMPNFFSQHTGPLLESIGRLRHLVIGQDNAGWQFGHPQLKEYLLEEHKIELNAPGQRLRGFCENWQNQPRPYALNYLASHLAASNDDAKLYAIVRNPQFHKVQRQVLKSLLPSFRDLRLALDRAIKTEAATEVLLLAAAYRDLLRTQGVAREVFAAVDKADPDFDEAAARARFFVQGPRAVGGWAQVLRGYLAWEAAVKGLTDVAYEMAKGVAPWYLGLERVVGGIFKALPKVLGLSNASIGDAFRVNTDELRDSLLVATARWLEPQDPKVALQRLAPFADRVAWLTTYRQSHPLDAQGEQATIKSVLEYVGYLFGKDFEYSMNPSLPEFTPEFSPDPEMQSEERAGEFVSQLRERMVDVSASLSGQDLITRVLRVVRINPYPFYRDNALVAIGMASLAAPRESLAWTRATMREIVKTGLEAEGIIFTLDLPAEITAEAGNDAASLPGLVVNAAAAKDRWGTRLRITSAQTAASFRRGERAASVNRLMQAIWDTEALGFAGYAVLNLLSAASRFVELGQPQNVQQPAPAPLKLGNAMIPDLNLMKIAENRAENVRDVRLRQRRELLVKQYNLWLKEEPPTFDRLENQLRNMGDPDARRAYIELASARWSASTEPLAKQWLGDVILLSLSDGTLLDGVLARYFAAYRDTIVNEYRMDEVVKAVEQSLSQGRPWEIRTAMLA